MKRIEIGEDMPRIDFKRYIPETFDSSSLPALKKKSSESLMQMITNTKAQIMHCENQLLNIELSYETT